MTVWTEQQLEMFLLWLRDTNCDPEYPLWKLYAATGARRSQLLALRFSDLDLKAGKLHIRRMLDLEDPDPRASSLSLSPPAVTVLRQRRRLLASRDINAVNPAAWVFPFDADWSRPRNPQSVSEMFTRRVSRAWTSPRWRSGSGTAPPRSPLRSTPTRPRRATSSPPRCWTSADLKPNLSGVGTRTDT
jgi:integrase